LLRVDLGPSALKPGISPEDIEHAAQNAMVIEDLEDDLRLSSARPRLPPCSRSSPSSVNRRVPSW